MADEDVRVAGRTLAELADEVGSAVLAAAQAKAAQNGGKLSARERVGVRLGARLGALYTVELLNRYAREQVKPDASG